MLTTRTRSASGPVRRALVALALTGLLAATEVASGSRAASASQPTPRVDVHVKGRKLIVEGRGGDDRITLRSPIATSYLVTVDLGDDGTADASVHRNRFDAVVVTGGPGNDVVRIDETAGVGAPFTDVVSTSIRGDDGDDVLIGGLGAETFQGGPGHDIVDGNQGDDTVSLGRGDDEITWEPGEGSDTIEGGDGQDLMTFTGDGGNETFTVEATGGRLRLTRNVGSIVMDVGGVERVDLNTLGGSDFTELNDLSGSGVAAVNIDGGVTLGVAGTDGIVDHVFVDGTDRADSVAISGGAGEVRIDGLAAAVTITDGDTFDGLLVSTMRGADRIDASALSADTPHLSVLAGAGNDVVLGGAGVDDILAGAGRDLVDGNLGSDRIALDQGDDTFTWDPGDGSDIVDGAGGFDALLFNGSGDDEVIQSYAIDDSLIVTRDVDNTFLDTVHLEQFDVNTFGGTDQLGIGDLTDAGIAVVDVNLGLDPGVVGADGITDVVTVTGTPGDDFLTVSGAAGRARIDGLSYSIDIVNSEPADALAFDGAGGADTVESSGLATDTIQLRSS